MVPIHHPVTSRLTIPAVDPKPDEPNYKQCAVCLEAVSAEPEPIGVSGDD